MPDLVVSALLTTAAGVVMIRLGLGTRLLSSRSLGRLCPSCGRQLEARVCRNCVRR